MSTKVIQGEMYVGRTNQGMIHIEIKDEASHVKFLDMEITPEQFTMLITSAVQSNVPMTVRDLHMVGMYRVREPRQIVCPLERFSKEDYEQWLVENAQEEGWILDSSLRSQSSIRRVGNEAILSYSVHKYVDNEGE